ncbi:MAG: hypothetical protein PHF76_10465, partial [Bacteroidales bacterium]|nr:hypothetical protein [Bacteroidales bacterium]
MKLLPFISLFFIALLTTTSLAAAEYVTPEKYQVTEYMDRYSLDQNNSYQLACEIGQFVSETYNWNCDIRQLNFSNHAPIYINVFYPAADNEKGYEAYYGWFGPQWKEVTRFTGSDHKMYYTDWHNPGAECYLSGLWSYGVVESYFGNVTEENRTVEEPVEDVIENESTQPVEIINSSHEDDKIIILNSSNNTVETAKVENNTIENN